ncbi:MAG: type II toxin-antitoxin system VapC family toxin [Terracidiphilus sp.]
MTGLDTNILVRFFTKDDPEQSSRAKELLRTLTPETPGFVTLVSLVELIWVLRSRYRWSKAQLTLCLERLLDSPELAVESHVAVGQALRRFSARKADFADCLIERSGHAGGCRETVTFDQDAATFAGMRLL